MIVVEEVNVSSIRTMHLGNTVFCAIYTDKYWAESLTLQSLSSLETFYVRDGWTDLKPDDPLFVASVSRKHTGKPNLKILFV